jgi:hypothetical protein
MFEGRKEGWRKENTGKKENRNILVKQERMPDTTAPLLPLLPLRCADLLQQWGVLLLLERRAYLIRRST